MAYSAGVRAPRGPRIFVWCRSLGCAICVIAGCYDGLDDAESPPGSPGGLCYPTNSCDVPATCEPVGKYCYDPADPCRGVFCNDHGMCTVDPESGLPGCVCDSGFSNFRYTLFCEPV